MKYFLSAAAIFFFFVVSSRQLSKPTNSLVSVRITQQENALIRPEFLELRSTQINRLKPDYDYNKLVIQNVPRSSKDFCRRTWIKGGPPEARWWIWLGRRKLKSCRWALQVFVPFQVSLSDVANAHTGAASGVIYQKGSLQADRCS